MARAFLQKHQLSAFLVVHPKLEEDFAGLAPGHPEARHIGDAGELLHLRAAQSCYSKDCGGKAFCWQLAMNRNCKDATAK